MARDRRNASSGVRRAPVQIAGLDGLSAWGVANGALAGRGLSEPLLAPCGRQGRRENRPVDGAGLALLRGHAGPPDAFFCPNDLGDAPISKSNVRDAWRAISEAAKVEDLRVHDLRHAFATRGAALGASALILRDALGHKTMAMTGRYVARQADPVGIRIVAADMLGVVGAREAAEVVPLKAETDAA